MKRQHLNDELRSAKAVRDAKAGKDTQHSRAWATYLAQHPELAARLGSRRIKEVK